MTTTAATATSLTKHSPNNFIKTYSFYDYIAQPYRFLTYFFFIIFLRQS
jgi:hypothetical protein